MICDASCHSNSLGIFVVNITNRNPQTVKLVQHINFGQIITQKITDITMMIFTNINIY